MSNSRAWTTNMPLPFHMYAAKMYNQWPKLWWDSEIYLLQYWLKIGRHVTKRSLRMKHYMDYILVNQLLKYNYFFLYNYQWFININLNASFAFKITRWKITSVAWIPTNKEYNTPWVDSYLVSRFSKYKVEYPLIFHTAPYIQLWCWKTSIL